MLKKVLHLIFTHKKISFPCLAVLFCIVVWVFMPQPRLWEGIGYSRCVFDRNGELLRVTIAYDQKYRFYVPLEHISPELVEATLLYEDRYFYEHPGVNPFALARVALSAFGGGRRMGASTITMQLARLRYKLDTKTIPGKLYQIWVALCLERHYSKQEILEAYFTLVPYGGNIEGVGAASLIYFNKESKNLSVPEALSLVTVPQNPTHRNPLYVARRGASPSLDDARLRLQEIWGKEHPESAENAFFSGLPLAVNSSGNLPFEAPHITTELLQNTNQQFIHATIDLRMQKMLEMQIERVVRQQSRLGLNNASALLVHWPTMEVRALVGSADFGNTTIEGQVDGTRAIRSPGSTLKPFIYALGLQQGLIHPWSLLSDVPKSFSGYDPENADQDFKGPISAFDALRLSRNIPAITLAQRLSQPDLYDFLQSAHAGFTKPKTHYGLALVLGGAEVRARTLAELYAMLANRGVWKPLKYSSESSTIDTAFATLIQNDRTLTGKVQDFERKPKQLLTPEASFITLMMLENNSLVERVRFIGQNRYNQLPIYWKTGTSNGMRDAWTVGVFGPYVLVVWIGNFDNTPNSLFLGAQTAAPLFLDCVEMFDSYFKFEDHIKPLRPALNVQYVDVCASTGDTDTSLCVEKAKTWFIPGVSPIEPTNVYRRILVNAETGLRACVEEPGKTEQVVWEFWPTNLQRSFRRAGIIKKPPPAFEPGCEAANSSGGIPPEIRIPKANIVYQQSLSAEKPEMLLFEGYADADVEYLFWFVDKRFIGKAAPDEGVMYQLEPGRFIVRVVDSLGRSHERMLQVDSIP